MTPLPLTGVQREDYLARLFGSHDFSVRVDVLDLDENPQGTASLTDGQVNLHADSAIRRTASLALSDPEGAFDFAEATGWSPRSVWADRLIRVTHTLAVPSAPGGRVPVTAFVGRVATIERSGADVQVECQDKSALAARGCPPMTVPKGMNAVDAIRKLLAERTGEFRFRLPRSKRRLSRPYSVGWADETSPLAVCTRIAEDELDMQLLWSADGYALVRNKPTASSLRVPAVTGAASMSADFTALVNWVQVSGHQRSTTKNLKGGGTVTTTEQPQAVAVARGSFAPTRLTRKGVPWYWPELVEADGLRKLEAVEKRARRTLAASDRLEDAPAPTCVPFFHGDADDLVDLATPDGDVQVRLGDVSIPLGVGGDMSIGAHRWVSKPLSSRVRGRVLRTKKVHRKRKGAK